MTEPDVACDATRCATQRSPPTPPPQSPPWPSRCARRGPRRAGRRAAGRRPWRCRRWWRRRGPGPCRHGAPPPSSEEVEGADVGGAVGEAVQRLQENQRRQRRIEAHGEPAHHRRRRAQHDQLDGSDTPHRRLRVGHQADLHAHADRPQGSRPAAGDALCEPVERAERVERSVGRLHSADRQQERQKETRAQETQRRQA